MWWSYQDAAKAKAKVQSEIVKRRKRGERFEALLPQTTGRKLCTTFWGQAWCRNLEAYQQYESRLPRGRSYFRQGNVYNLVIEKEKVSAVVAGSELYDTKVIIQPLKAARWHDIVEKCEGQVGSMFDLMAGKLGDGVMSVLSHAEDGLFPKPKEIRFDCSCPDHADMCKHVSAVLYAVGVLLDGQPELLFKLRGVDGEDLLAKAKDAAVTGMAESTGELDGADLSAIFGIEIAEPVIEVKKVTKVKKAAKKAKKTAKKKTPEKPAKRTRSRGA